MSGPPAMRECFPVHISRIINLAPNPSSRDSNNVRDSSACMKPDDMREEIIIDFIEQMFAVGIQWEISLMLFFVLFLVKALENITVVLSLIHCSLLLRSLVSFGRSGDIRAGRATTRR